LWREKQKTRVQSGGRGTRPFFLFSHKKTYQAKALNVTLYHVQGFAECDESVI
jgi:hypothetical protein